MLFAACYYCGMRNDTTAADHACAQSLLDKGEELLWLSKPKATWMVGGSRMCFMLGCCLVLVGCVTEIAGHLCMPELFCGFNFVVVAPVALCLLPGLVLGVLIPLVKYRQMGRWLYVITDRRAMVITHCDIKEWALAPHMVRDYRPEAPGSIVFGYEESWLMINKPWMAEEGFLRCSEAGEALELLERLLAGQARPMMAAAGDTARMKQLTDDAAAMRLAASPWTPAGWLLMLLVAVGGICSAPWWWACLGFPLNVFALLMACLLLSAGVATLCTYCRGKRLLARRNEPPE